MKLFRYLLVFGLALSCTLPLFAGEWKYKDSGFAFWIPDEWAHEWDSDEATFTAWDAGNGPQFEFYAPAKVTSLENALESLGTELDLWLHDIELGTPELSTINDLNVLLVSGSGKLDVAQHWMSKDVEVEFAVAVYQADNKFFLVFGFIDSNEFENHKKNIRKILGSIHIQE